MKKLMRYKAIPNYRIRKAEYSIMPPPVPWPCRKTVPLIVGREYFFAFNYDVIRRGTLIEVFTRNDGAKMVRIKSDWNEFILFADEIHETIPGSLLNQVTN